VEARMIIVIGTQLPSTALVFGRITDLDRESLAYNTSATKVQACRDIKPLSRQAVFGIQRIVIIFFQRTP
jgi:hypothetical protein